MELNLQRKNWFITIQYEKSNKSSEQIKAVIQSLSAYGYIYYASHHDKDVKATGADKWKHYHLLLCCESRQRGSTLLSFLVSIFDLPADCFSLMPTSSVAGSVQYLIHKNEDSNVKYHYPVSIIFTNAQETILNDLLNTDISLDKLDFETLKRLWIESNFDKFTLMQKIGLSRYNTYQRTITEFIKLYGYHEPIEELPF